MTDISRERGTDHPQDTVEERISRGERLEALLAALEDSDCRTIMEATSEDALSASEIADQCGIALSTTYRKIEQLSDAELVAERVRLDSKTKYTHEYTLAFDRLKLHVTPENGLEVVIFRTPGAETPDESGEQLIAD